MVIRVLGVIVGALLLFGAVYSALDGAADARMLGGGFMGVVFIAYGVGGQRLLARLAPRYASKDRTPKP